MQISLDSWSLECYLKKNFSFWSVTSPWQTIYYDKYGGVEILNQNIILAISFKQHNRAYTPFIPEICLDIWFWNDDKPVCHGDVDPWRPKMTDN